MDMQSRLAHLTHQLALGVRYHAARQTFFGRWYRFTQGFTLFGSLGALAALVLAHPWVSAALVAAVAVSQVFFLAQDVHTLAHLHNQLRRRYLAIEADLLGAGTTAEHDYSRLLRKIKAIEHDEPPILRRLMDICTNETLHVAGYAPGDEGVTFAHTPWYRRLLANV